MKLQKIEQEPKYIIEIPKSELNVLKYLLDIVGIEQLREIFKDREPSIKLLEMEEKIEQMWRVLDKID